MNEERAGLPILLFADAGVFATWLADQPADAPGAWLRIAKKGAPLTTLTKPEAIDTALCHGWIDGQQHPYDEASWLTRFTPRTSRSRWSQVNRTRALHLIELGHVMPAGHAAIKAARADGRWDAAYAPASKATVPEDLQTALDARPNADAFFATLTGANRYAVLYRIASIMRAETRARRIVQFVDMLERGETVHR